MIHNSRSTRFSRGFTLVELLVTMGIMGVLSTLLITNFRVSSKNKIATNQTASAIVSDIRRAQSLALSGSLMFQGSNICGYGLHYVDALTYYIYAKNKPVGACSTVVTRNYSGDTIVETRKIGNTNLEIRAAFSDIFFEPPDPKTYINNLATITDPATITVITIQPKSQAVCDPQACTDVTISTAGKIDIR